MTRRAWLLLAGMGALRGASGRPLRGIFPIAQTPFTPAGALDVESLVRQVRFLDRGGVHGCVWPQLASEWSTLSEAERLEGAEAIVSAAKGLRPAIVIGVQAADAAAAARYAKHAAKIGADAAIALPPPMQTAPDALLEYYREVGKATDLPLFAQAVGNLSVDFLLRLWKEVPTLRYVKDEAGEPLLRVGRLREESKDELKVFTGAHGRTLLDEMARGTSGSMPAASVADLYAQVWDLWHAGKQDAAIETFGRTLLFINEVQVYGVESLKYILELRGVFKTHSVRRQGGGEAKSRFDETGKKMVAKLVEWARPWFRA
jgi:dihydrodipicolinate synthase/N-acetylneuraminate lyase